MKVLQDELPVVALGVVRDGDLVVQGEEPLAKFVQTVGSEEELLVAVSAPFFPFVDALK